MIAPILVAVLLVYRKWQMIIPPSAGGARGGRGPKFRVRDELANFEKKENPGKIMQFSNKLVIVKRLGSKYVLLQLRVSLIPKKPVG